MRNRTNTADKGTAVRFFRLGLGASALCLSISAGQAQSLSGSSSSSGTYPLRGTSDRTTTTATSSAASTLYGALPSPRPATSLPDAAGTDASGFSGYSTQSGRLSNETRTIADDPYGPASSPSDLTQADQDYSQSLARQNQRTGTIDDLPLDGSSTDDAPTGLSIGTLTLRPTLDQKVIHESVRYGSTRTSRNYSQTTASATLQSDWSRHSLNVDGTGTWQKNISGVGTESPSANLDARLNLDLLDDFSALLGAGYSYSQESRTDPNAISGASTQAGIHELRASVGLQKSLGILRGTTGLEVTRKLYSDATLPDGTKIVVDDRNTVGAELTTRLGYELSPALIPFVEASLGREKYDQRVDSTGAERSSNTYGIRVGAEVDLGEKLSGEFSGGYVLRKLDDRNLADISGFTADGDLNWSPSRGTDINLGLATTLESATVAGQSGAIVYELDSTLSQQIRSNVVARLGASASFRDYDSGSGRKNQRSYGLSTGLTWSINRYLDFEADASYERTREPGATDEETARIGVGLKLRR